MTIGKPMRIAALALTMASTILTEANALQRGAPAYPLGVDTLYPADLPPIPGLFLLSYTLDYQIKNIKDGKGNDLFGGFSGRVTGVGLRPIYVWDTTVFGARPVSYLVAPIMNRSFGANTINIPGGPTAPFSAVNRGKYSQSSSGVGDLFFGQVLDWKLNHGISAFVGFEVSVPTGDYDKNKFFNIASNNYYTFTPNVGITWRSPDNYHASLKVQYSTSTQNEQGAPGLLASGIDLARYQSGDFLTVEYAVGIGLSALGLSKDWGLDVAGFALVQTTSDYQNGNLIPNSKSRLFGVGPQLRYNFGPAALAVKVEREFGARNSTEGNRYWFQIGFPLWIKNAPSHS